MSTQIIAENILRSTHYSSCTEQEGAFWKQPTPTVTGKFRLQAQGAPTAFTYSGTTTSSGSTTTVIDSVLAMFGDDYFIGGTVAITSGACNGESKAITDFAQATGTITTAAFSATIGSGITFTLTVPVGTRDFRVQLITGGDAGDATFKWSHNGGTTWLGRDNPDQATWLGSKTLVTAAQGVYEVAQYNRYASAQLSNGNIIVLFCGGTNDLHRIVSTDGGASWSAPASVGTVLFGVCPAIHCLTVLSSGRLLLTTSLTSGGLVYYSDDDGASWSYITTNLPADGGSYAPYIIELSGPNHLLAATCVGSDRIWVQTSDDGGETWGTAVVVSDATGVQKNPVLLKNRKGEILCIFESSEDAGGVFDLKYQLSTDNGVTWAADALIFNAAGAVDYLNAHAIMDFNGDLYVCCAYQSAGTTTVHLKRSTDNGTTWGTDREVTSTTCGLYDMPWMTLLNTGTIMLTQFDGSENLKAYFRGMWETYSSNACACRMDTKPQELVSGAKLVWLGGQGEVDDSWTFTAGYSYAATNLLEPSPAVSLRSTQDNIAFSVVFDAGAYNRFTMSGAAFFGCNVRTLTFQMHDADIWTSPAVNQSVSFDVTTGIIQSVYGDDVVYCADLADYKDHYFRNMYFRLTSGSDSGSTYKIKDSAGGYLTLDSITAATAFTNSDEFVIYQGKVATTFTTAACRYIAIAIAAQDTAEEYYEIGTLIAGMVTTLSRAWSAGYGVSRQYSMSVQRSPSQSPIIQSLGNPRDVLTLRWKGTSYPEEIEGIIDLLDGRPYVIIPDSTNLLDCSLVVSPGAISETHIGRGLFSLEIEAEEVT